MTVPFPFFILEMDNQPEEESKKSKLSPQQRRNIEELVRLSPQVIQSRVRRDALCTSEVLGQYAGTKPDEAHKNT
jgi:hypothetical protein